MIINNQLSVYVPVANRIVKNAEAKGLNVRRVNLQEVSIAVRGLSDLLVKLIKLRNGAKKSEWIFGECEDGNSDES